MRQGSLKAKFPNLIAPQIECNPDKRSRKEREREREEDSAVR